MIIAYKYPKRYFIIVAAAVVSILFLIFVYPRLFKQPKFNDSYLFDENSQFEFSYSGIWRGCNVIIQPTKLSNPSSIDIIRGRLEGTFSPWIPSLRDILHEESYFHTLNFDECFAAINSEYPNTNIESLIFDGAQNAFLRVGGLTEFSVPLSHANTILIFAPLNGKQKIILLKGGN